MKRTEQIGVRLTAEEKAAIERVARQQKKNPSEWLRSVALSELGRILVNVAATTQEPRP